MTTIYLATLNSAPQHLALVEFGKKKEKPGILISFAHLSSMKDLVKEYKGYKLVLDSGAYSAYNSGKVIDIEALIEETKNPIWGESVALDVIGDAEGSVKNSLYMKSKGSPAYPVFHYGDPWEHLAEYKKEFPKVGLSCRFGETVEEATAWLEQCFARAWPHKFHSFGWTQESTLMKFPFHSADSSSWTAAGRFGKWFFARGQHLGLNRPSARKAAGDLYMMPEIQHYFKLQQKVQSKWRVEFLKQGWIEQEKINA